VNAYKEMARLTMAEAAERLGVKEQAIRKRIQRGTIVHDKDDDGRVYVYVDPYENTDPSARHQGTSTDNSTSTHTLIESLQDQIEFLRGELQRKDTILMTMAQRIPELEPAPEQRESPVSASEDEGTGEPPDQEKRS